jgi:DNA primase
MISAKTIEEVKALPIADVVSGYVTLKKTGANLSAPCPLHDEKSASFTVSPAKGIFKCFGCGKAGDSITFVMEKEGVNFGEAVENIAKQFQIPLEYAKKLGDKEQAAATAAWERKQAAAKALSYAAGIYAEKGLPDGFAKKRPVGQEIQDKFLLGQTVPKFVEGALKAGFTLPALQNAALATDEGRDKFWDRAMFPIHDIMGNVVAFTGRALSEPQPDKPFAKYMNSPDTVWEKGAHLYGLYQAKEAIKKKGYAYLLEGNMGVIAFHDRGINTAVASCGTSLTEKQCKLLYRFCKNVTIVADNDGEAGIKALHRSAKMLIQHGFAVSVLMPQKGKDPEDQIRACPKEEDLNAWIESEQKYITQYLPPLMMERAEASPEAKGEALTEMGALVESIGDHFVRKAYYDTLCKVWTDFKQYKLIKNEEAPTLKHVDAEVKDHYLEFEFFERGNSYFALEKKKEKLICNFSIEILYFILSENEPSYVCRFTNDAGKHALRAITTDDFSSKGNFKKTVGRMGNYIFSGTEEHLDYIKIKIFRDVVQAVKPLYMGYNPNYDMYVWANGLYKNGQLNEPDKYGISRLPIQIASIEDFKRVKPETQVSVDGAEKIINNSEKFVEDFGEKKLELLIDKGRVFRNIYFYLPFADKLKLVGDEDDDYENERKFRCNLARKKDAEVLTFETWAKLFSEVYNENNNYIFMILWYVAAVFRDVIYKGNNSYFPLLNLFGPRQKGKSTAARSLVKMFGEGEEDGINVEGGSTHTGIRRYMASFQNGVVWLNEYKNNISPILIGMIKGIADGSGKMTGRATGGNHVKMYKPRSGAILCGQDMPTKDPALKSRCITLEFAGSGRAYQKFEELVRLEGELHTTKVTCEVIGHRDLIEKGYKKREPSVTAQLKKAAAAKSMQPDDRTILNLTSVLTPMAILLEAGVKFPFTWDQAFACAMGNIEFEINVQRTSDDVEQFFFVIQSLVGKSIIEGEHFKIERDEDGKVLLYLRVLQIAGFYRQAAVQQQITPLDLATLRNYLLKHSSYVCYKSGNVRFAMLANRTSSFVFDYGKLTSQGIELSSKTEIAALVSKPKESENAFEKAAALYEHICSLRLNLLYQTQEVMADTAATKEEVIASLKTYQAEHQGAISIKNNFDAFMLLTPF